MSPLFIQLSPHIVWQMRTRHLKWFPLSGLPPSRLLLHSRDSCIGCWPSQATHIKLGAHSCSLCMSSSADSAIGFQSDIRHPVSFNQLLNHTAAKLGLKAWTCSHTLVWAANWNCLLLGRHSEHAVVYNGSCIWAVRYLSRPSWFCKWKWSF